MKAFVTGALGFLGRHLLERLNGDGWDVVVYDRKPPEKLPSAHIMGDVLNPERLIHSLKTVQPDVVFHLAALADVRSALKMPEQQVAQNLLATFNVLEAMKASECKRIAFTSTAVVYGDTPNLRSEWFASTVASAKPKMFPVPIDERSWWFPQQTSIYGAMKLASESLISAYCEGYGFSADIYRLVSVVGAGYRHGNLMDFYKRLKENPKTLKLFGSPTQEKFYIDVHDVMDAIALTVARQHAGCELWNVSHDQPNTISDSIQAVCDGLAIPMPEILGGDSWPGDLPQLVLDCSKLRGIGWAPKVPISAGMAATVADLIARHVDA